MMETEYGYALKSDKLVAYSRISFIFFVINILSLLIVGYLAAAANQRLYAFSGGVLILLWLVYVLLRGRHITNIRTRFTPGYGFLVFLWIKLQFYWIAPIVLLLGMLDYIARRPMVVFFSTQYIHYPSFPAQKITWGQLQNVVLKDGLLTIDFTNNKMVQTEIEEEPSTEETVRFNAFARECIDRLS